MSIQNNTQAIVAFMSTITECDKDTRAETVLATWFAAKGWDTMSSKDLISSKLIEYCVSGHTTVREVLKWMEEDKINMIEGLEFRLRVILGTVYQNTGVASEEQMISMIDGFESFCDNEETMEEFNAIIDQLNNL